MVVILTRIERLTSFASLSICSGFRPVYANIPIYRGQPLVFQAFPPTAYLRRNVAPVMLASQILQVLLQQRSHLDDTVRHSFHLPEPLFIQLWSGQDLGSDTGTMDRRVRVKGPHEDLELGVDTLLLFRRLTADRECANTLAVEALGRVSEGFSAVDGSWTSVPCSWRNSEQGRIGGPGFGNV